ncbi:MAG TPA: hypothetical protein VFS63_07905 [Pseudolabrys sp.]|nr:hypothetical protein [Pseudolabrys sp.]
MRTILAAGAALLLLGAAAQADTDDQQQQEAKQPTVGVGVICDTQQQAEKFITLRAQGEQPENAMQSVNADAKKDQACGVAAIVFKRDAIVANEKLNGKLVQVVRINVMAGYNGSGWERVQDMTQYAIFEGGGETI